MKFLSRQYFRQEAKAPLGTRGCPEASSAFRSVLSLVDGKVVVLYGKGEDRHGSGVDLSGAVFRTTAMPRTVPALELEHDVLHLLACDFGVVTTSLVHCL